MLRWLPSGYCFLLELLFAPASNWRPSLLPSSPSGFGAFPYNKGHHVILMPQDSVEQVNFYTNVWKYLFDSFFCIKGCFSFCRRVIACELRSQEPLQWWVLLIHQGCLFAYIKRQLQSGFCSFRVPRLVVRWSKVLYSYWSEGNRIINEVVPQHNVTFVAQGSAWKKKKTDFLNCPCGNNAIQVYELFCWDCVFWMNWLKARKQHNTNQLQ